MTSLPSVNAAKSEPRVEETDPRGITPDPQWYKHAVFYEVLLKAFGDSDGDGVGDIRGLISHLDYIQWLGIDCIWIPPFYPSPGRDGGYDVADYTAVDPVYGTMDDFRELVEKAHDRGIRVIIDIVINHTSADHPWFQSSRSNPDGPYGDFYVWADDDAGYSDARIIFVDTETSNWAFDPVRKQYYWHRFFSHQPDLNFENPKVHAAVMDVFRFWCNLGVDGLRLDAIPYLYEEEGTNCENLPQTHAFIAKVRAMLDEEFPGTILLAEANQWPNDVVEYFGTDEQPECHMCFHFPVMPRIYYALRDQRATAIIDILRDTPAIPRDAQWGTFLRNHDELTLEMVTTEERASMYKWYAEDSRMRANVGIRRRLASLLGNSRAEVELAHALLLSLPGSPYLYYGDEIGMGDNIWLSDRDGVRTPMQWSPDRNAGFSTADPGKLYLPAISSLAYNYQAVNVESQLSQPASLLHWIHGILEVRSHHPVMGSGDFTLLDANNEAILAFTRSSESEVILCVMNLANTARAANLSIPHYAGWQVTDVFGGAGFPGVAADGSYTVTLGSRDSFWLKLEAPGVSEPAPREGARASETGETVDYTTLSKPSVEDAEPEATDEAEPGGEAALVHALERWVYRARWYRGEPQPLEVLSAATLAEESNRKFVWLLVRSGEIIYNVPVVSGGEAGLLTDAAQDPFGQRILLAACAGGTDFSSDELTLRSRALAAASYSSAHILRGEQSNTSIIYDGEPPVIVKLFRVFEPGKNPDVELQTALADTGTVPAQFGSARLEVEAGASSDVVEESDGLATGTLATDTLAADALTAQEFLRGGEDAWRVITAALASSSGALGDLEEPIRDLGKLTRTYLTELAERLGTAPASKEAIAAQRASWEARAERAMAQVPALGEYRRDITAIFDAGQAANWPDLQRIHGDYHLGQVLRTPAGWVALDFEGEPLRPLSERQAPDVPLRDVAGMLRSFGYAAGQGEREGAGPAMRAWLKAAQKAFLSGYGEIPRDQQPLLNALVLDKALYEVSYEVAQRPDWLEIPLSGVAQVLRLSDNKREALVGS